ncbi:uncharacterized protein LAJ45_04214 [Morchella importuna]|uniref:Oxysterol-binding protein-like protein n=1 Tax=Morchella conica CCBAS932 TaxID=1392247 RepID=A0A3N4L131_9PEZI|nr:uncharacterized protein LAJ45_04214 [Morchella importuna]KAH8151592.1 hypothetical protein LAJ45_04214 [Morchella importuna]RPB15202.1 hypothetical protein P167DRAFT_581910 [Morchella conica CCBAS932]
MEPSSNVSSTHASTSATPSTTPPSGTISSAVSDAGDQSKLKILLGILKRFVGVSDIASVRFSLPSQLLEPVPNLEYWNYLDRPETFISIGDSNDELERFLGVLRFWFTKDLKFVKGKPCKPYNSTLGEFFRCSWDVEASLPPVSASRPASRSSAKSKAASTATTPAPTPTNKAPIRVSFLTEQTSHHPPVSAFYIDCPEKGISARGYDQISAKFTGTSIRVTPGEHNLGIFINLHNRGDECYRLTHPAASLGGILRGSLNLYVEDVCYVTCPKTKLKVILQYLGDSWLGKAKHRVEGVVYEYNGEEDGITRLKDVPSKAIRAKIEGSWMNQLYYILPGSTEKILLIDLDPLLPANKICPPLEVMLPNESRKMWQAVSEAIHAKDYARATQLKCEIEDRQREKAAARTAENIDWKPRFFEAPSLSAGQPSLSKDGELVLKGLHSGNYALKPSDVTGA